MKPKIGIYLTDDVAKRLTIAARRPSAAKSGFANETDNPTAGFVSALWFKAIGPPLGFIAAWAALGLVHALAAMLIAVLAILIATAGTLLAADWRADFESRQAWAQIDIAAVGLGLCAEAATPSAIDPPYRPGADNEALRRVFSAHRCGTSARGHEHLPEAPGASHAAPAWTQPDRPMATPTVPEAAGAAWLNSRARRAVASKPAVFGCAPRKNAATVAAWAAMCHGWARTGPPMRLVGNAEPQWPTRDRGKVVQVAFARPAVNIVVLCGDRDDRARPFPEGSTSGNIGSKSEPPSCRGPPQVAGGHRRPPAPPARLSLIESARRVPAAGARPTVDPVVRDNLGPAVPICAAELEVIETYLDDVLRDVLATAAVQQDEA